MKELDVKHFLEIYQNRLQMQELGITNPSSQVKKFTREFVEKLSKLPLDEKIRIEKYSFFDEADNLIATIPIEKDEKKFAFVRVYTDHDREDYYHLYLIGSSVCFDFNKSLDNKISLVGIYFEDFGRCDFHKKAIALSSTESSNFIYELENDKLNQPIITELVKKMINLNKDFIWTKALEKYNLI